MSEVGLSDDQEEIQEQVIEDILDDDDFGGEGECCPLRRPRFES